MHKTKKRMWKITIDGKFTKLNSQKKIYKTYEQLAWYSKLFLYSQPIEPL